MQTDGIGLKEYENIGEILSFFPQIGNIPVGESVGIIEVIALII
jgi:hypothetical protein